MEKTSFLETHRGSFVHLHLHTQYSLLDGAIRIKDLMQTIAGFGMPAVAQTDHGNMFGAIDFYKAAKAAKIKPILGSEVYFTTGSRHERRQLKNTSDNVSTQDEMENKHHIHHLVLLCQNLTGYENLCKILSHAYMEGFYYKPRTDFEILKRYSEGLIATTACLKGEVAYNFLHDKDERAHEAIEKLLGVYGDRLYLEVQENGLPEQAKVNKKIITHAHERGIPLVATNDCHYLQKDDALAQEVLLCIQTQKTYDDDKRMKMSSHEFYVKSAEEMRRSFHYLPEACDNTLRIADQCNVELKWTDEKGRQIYHLPDFKIETSESTPDYFRRMVAEGLEKRFAGPHFKKLISSPHWEQEEKAKYLERLNSETEMIIQMGFAGYFLIVSDFIKWAKSQGIAVGPGRGSGAGSLVAYSLEITNINPLPFNLLFERFINPERISMPDFDVDFCQDRRGEVINYVTTKYGTERVGQIITFGKLQAKAVIRDVARVFSLPYTEADMLAKLVPEELGITLENAIKKEPKLQELEEKDPKIRQILKIAKKLEGLLRHASIHAAGVVITNKPLVDYCPLYKGRDNEQVIQFDKDYAEYIGLVKFDFLGLKTLTVIDKASHFIRRDHKDDFDIEDIDLEDKKVYEFVSSGKTTGVFQLESAGMKDLCKRIRPDNLDDITAINALYRPGPLGSGMVDDFVEIKHGRKETRYPFPELIPILKDTYGIVVYQEQVQNIARIIAGYTLGQADILRRAMGKKKMDVMEQHRKIFEAGAIQRGFDGAKAVELYDLMAKFAEYGFNKSHAVAYALIAYQTAFLKLYYPASFYAALLSTELSNTDKVTIYIQDAKAMGVQTLPPDVNESLWQFNVVGNNIRFGLGAIKNVGEGAVQGLVVEREKNGPYKGLVDFCERVDQKLINKRVLESLIKVGVFDNCEKMNRKTCLNNLEKIMNHANKVQEERALGQGNLFSLLNNTSSENTLSASNTSFLDIELVDDFDQKEKLSYESELMGIYVSGHPLEKYQDLMSQLSSMNINEVHELEGQGNRELTLSGMVVTCKNFITKKGDKMAFITLEDLTGKIEGVVFPKAYNEFTKFCQVSDEAILIRGEVTLDEEKRSFKCYEFKELKLEADNKIKEIEINLDLSTLNPHTLGKLKSIITDHRGAIPLKLIFNHGHGRALMPLSDNFLINPGPKFQTRVNELLQSNSIKYIVEHTTEAPLHSSRPRFPARNSYAGSPKTFAN